LEARLGALEEAFAKVVDFNDALKLVPIKQDFYFKDELFKKSKKAYQEFKEAIKTLMRVDHNQDSEKQAAGEGQSAFNATQFGNQHALKIQEVKFNKLNTFLNRAASSLLEQSKSVTNNFYCEAIKKWAEIEANDDEIQIEAQDTDDLSSYNRKYRTIQLRYEEMAIKLQKHADLYRNLCTAIETLKFIGLKVKVVVSDYSNKNDKIYRNLKQSVVYKNILYFFDPIHILSNIRIYFLNNLIMLRFKRLSHVTVINDKLGYRDSKYWVLDFLKGKGSVGEPCTKTFFPPYYIQDLIDLKNDNNNEFLRENGIDVEEINSMIIDQTS
jgi:hypothetical protein